MRIPSDSPRSWQHIRERLRAPEITNVGTGNGTGRCRHFAPSRAALRRTITARVDIRGGNVLTHNAGVAGSSPAPAISIEGVEGCQSCVTPCWRKSRIAPICFESLSFGHNGRAQSVSRGAAFFDPPRSSDGAGGGENGYPRVADPQRIRAPMRRVYPPSHPIETRAEKPTLKKFHKSIPAV